MGEAEKLFIFEGVRMSNLEVSQEMLVFMLEQVSSQVSGFPLVSLCLWRKLQNLSFWRVL